MGQEGLGLHLRRKQRFALGLLKKAGVLSNPVDIGFLGAESGVVKCASFLC
jgi:hypothetical protein